MKNSKKLLPLALVAAAVATFATPAQAVQTLVLTPPSATFGNDGVGAAGSATAAFTNTFTFVTPTGFNISNGTLSTSALGGSNIDFTSAFLNGTAFTLTAPGTFEFGSLANTALVTGGTNTLTISGFNTGDGAYSGTLTFAAVSSVPEPATWAMMLLGFGAMGVSVRRRRRTTTLAQAV